MLTALLRKGAAIDSQSKHMVSMVLLNSMFLVLSVVVWVV
jgi:hypothetical protein